jgi:uncharacterized membrane protein YfcA
LGIINYSRAGFVEIENIKIGLTIATLMFLGTYIGSKWAVGLQSATLTRMFAGFLVIVAIRLWFTAK